MYQHYICRARDGVRLTISADLESSDAPIKVVTTEGERATHYISSDAGHNQVQAGMLANAWLGESGHEAWADCERIAVLRSNGEA